MLEYDIGSYRRKFSGTFAYCSGPGQELRWRYIYNISDKGVVYVSRHARDEKHFTLGYLPQAVLDDKQAVHFEYKPFECGIYSAEGGNTFILLTRRHRKNFQIGIGDEGYNATVILRDTATPYMIPTFTNYAVDLSNQVVRYEGEIGKIFSSQLYLHRESLYLFNSCIGLVEDGVAILKDKRMIPLIEPHLEGTCQILPL